MIALLLALAAAQAAPAPATPGPAAPPRTPSDVVAAAPASAWEAIAPADLLVMTLAPDAAGKARQVVIQLAPDPLSAPWTANIRALAKAKWWDGTSINRVQDNYVVQWGDATEKKPLPSGLGATREADYTVARELAPAGAAATKAMGPQNTISRWEGFYRGFPVAAEGTPDSAVSWPTHCYASVGVGRNVSPDAGTGAELYAVIGHAPRQLDRNIAVVGRVIAGIEHLASLPRGTEALGFYATAAERVPIASLRLASELPAADRPRFEQMRTEGAAFVDYVRLRANRKDDFYIRPAGWADVCNVPVPVRRVP